MTITTTLHIDPAQADGFPAISHPREALYNALEREARIGHYLWNSEKDRFQYCSPEYARIFGTTAAELMAAEDAFDKVLARVHANDRERYRRLLRGPNANGRLDTGYRIVHDNGDIRYLHETGVYVDSGHRPHHQCLGFVQDVTDRAGPGPGHPGGLEGQADMMPDFGFYLCDDYSERYVYISEGFAHIHGTTVKDCLNSLKYLEDDINRAIDADRDRLAAAYQHYIDTGETLDIEYRIRRTDGEKRWIRELNYARSMKHGCVFHTIGVLQDITRQKEIEMELLEKDASASHAGTFSVIGHFIHDNPAGRFRFVSPGMSIVYGVDSVSLLQRRPSARADMAFVHPEDRDRLRAVYRESNGARKKWQIEFRLVRPDGETRWIREIARTQPLDRGAGTQTIGVMMDITSQQAAAP